MLSKSSLTDETAINNVVIRTRALSCMLCLSLELTETESTPVGNPQQDTNTVRDLANDVEIVSISLLLNCLYGIDRSIKTTVTMPII